MSGINADSLLLLAGAGVFALLFALNALVKTLARRVKIGFLDLLLAFGAALLTVGGLIYNYLPTSAGLFPFVLPWVLAGAAALAVFCAVIAALELARPEKLRGSRAILGWGVSILAALSTLAVPYASVTLEPTPAPVRMIDSNGLPVALGSTPAAGAAQAASTSEATGEAEQEPTLRPTATNTATARPTATPTLTRTPAPTATPFATRTRGFASRTPTPTQTLVTPCVAQVLYNLRLREAPNEDAETLAVIPFDTAVAMYARSEDGAWWYVLYENQEGWIDGQYIRATSACDQLPEREA